MDATPGRPRQSNFRQFFFRGLGILLPTVLTIWILVAVYGFVNERIADPINRGVRQFVLRATPGPSVSEAELREFERNLSPEQLRAWRAAGLSPAWVRMQARRQALREWWNRASIGSWAVLDLIGLLLAIMLIYAVGLLLGGYLGRRLYRRGEELLKRLPLFKQVYPYVKQVTDFFVGDEDKMQFNQVVAVEYPRKGIWSVALVTGGTMHTIEGRATQPCYTLFVPSSPTPFTGYVITVPVADTIDLPISIDDALRFTVSGGVIVPPHELIGEGAASRERAAEEAYPRVAEPNRREE